MTNYWESVASEQHLVWASLGWHLQNTGGYGCTDSSKCRRDKQGRQKQSVRHLACNYSWWLVVLYSFPISQETTPALLITVYDVYSTTWFPFRLQPCRGGKKTPPKCPRKIQGYMATRKTPRTCHAFLLVSRLAALIFTCHRTHVLFFFFFRFVMCGHVYAYIISLPPLCPTQLHRRRSNSLLMWQFYKTPTEATINETVSET